MDLSNSLQGIKQSLVKLQLRTDKILKKAPSLAVTEQSYTKSTSDITPIHLSSESTQDTSSLLAWRDVCCISNTTPIFITMGRNPCLQLSCILMKIFKFPLMFLWASVHQGIVIYQKQSNLAQQDPSIQIRDSPNVVGPPDNIHSRFILGIMKGGPI